MDNLTHSLVGVLLARAALPWVGSLRGALWAGILASNAPDIDLVLTPFFEDPRLGYLVHHRGHTHTVAVGLLLAAGVTPLARWRDRAARTVPLAALAVLGVGLHIFADAWNNYGVHPFWGIQDDWYYGDFIFILEPLLWLALWPLAWTTAAKGPARIAVALVGTGLAAATTFGLGAGFAVAWVVATAALTLVQRRWDKVALPTLVALGALLAFGSGSRAAEADLRARLAADRPAETLLDVALTPRPATPWCWQGAVLSHDATRYHARTVLLSLAPALTTPPDCALREADRTAPLIAPDLASDARVLWGPRFEAPVDGLARLAAADCRVDAFTRFARAPYWVEDGARVIVGDLRYDSEPGLGFAEIETLRTDPPDRRGCGHLPAWRPALARRLLGEMNKE